MRIETIKAEVVELEAEVVTVHGMACGRKGFKVMRGVGEIGFFWAEQQWQVRGGWTINRWSDLSGRVYVGYRETRDEAVAEVKRLAEELAARTPPTNEMRLVG